MEQPTLFDPVEAHRVTEQAIKRVDQAASPEWKARALMAVEYLARARTTFTADDVWEFLNKANVEMPAEPSALGPIMRQAVKQGTIRFTGDMVKSQRPSKHQQMIRVWTAA